MVWISILYWKPLINKPMGAWKLFVMHGLRFNRFPYNIDNFINSFLHFHVNKTLVIHTKFRIRNNNTNSHLFFIMNLNFFLLIRFEFSYLILILLIHRNHWFIALPVSIGREIRILLSNYLLLKFLLDITSICKISPKKYIIKK